MGCRGEAAVCGDAWHVEGCMNCRVAAVTRDFEGKEMVI